MPIFTGDDSVWLGLKPKEEKEVSSSLEKLFHFGMRKYTILYLSFGAMQHIGSIICCGIRWLLNILKVKSSNFTSQKS